MSNALRNTLILIGVVVSGSVLLLAGMTIGRVGLSRPGFWSWMSTNSPDQPAAGFWGAHPMVGIDDHAKIAPFETMMESGMMGYGMMSHSMEGTGMMSPFTSSGLFRADPLTLGETQQAIEEYLIALDNQDLTLGEIMIFDNHAYAQIIEARTGIGAFEVLVNPVTLDVTPEPGANMMWNLKYSPIGMMGGFGSQLFGYIGDSTASQDILDEMPVDTEEAIQVAQRYLGNLSGATVGEHVEAFYGYYTLHILEEGEIVGMLSVNGYSREVLLHTWHGDLLGIAEAN